MYKTDIVYLDNNATTPVGREVYEAMAEISGIPFNASSVHSLGRRGRSIVEAAREKIAILANAGGARIVFTSSGTESNNMALRGLKGYKVLVSGIEHVSVLRLGVHEYELPVSSSGIVDISRLEDLLAGYGDKKLLVSVMLANNETGVVQPVKQIAAIVHKHGGLVHTDAAQCFGKINVDMAELGVDMLTVSAHKFGGPQGAAALIIGKDVPVCPFIFGGGQEQGYRPGTENIPAIHGFGAAAMCAAESREIMRNMQALRDKVEEEISGIAPDVVIFGRDVARLPNTSMIAMRGVQSETQVMHFDLDCIAVSGGAACSSGKVESSHVLHAMGIEQDLAGCALRVSFGINNTMQDAERFVSAWQKLYERTVALSS